MATGTKTKTEKDIVVHIAPNSPEFEKSSEHPTVNFIFSIKAAFLTPEFLADEGMMRTVAERTLKTPEMRALCEAYAEVMREVAGTMLPPLKNDPDAKGRTFAFGEKEK